MKIGVSINIDVTKIDKSRLVAGKDGAKYLDLSGFIDIDNPNEYGNHGFVTQAKKKGEDKSLRLPILGNSKVFWKEHEAATHDQGMQQAQQAMAPQQDDFDDDIPF